MSTIILAIIMEKLIGKFNRDLSMNKLHKGSEVVDVF